MTVDDQVGVVVGLLLPDLPALHLAVLDPGSVWSPALRSCPPAEGSRQGRGSWDPTPPKSVVQYQPCTEPGSLIRAMPITRYFPSSMARLWEGDLRQAKNALCGLVADGDVLALVGVELVALFSMRSQGCDPTR